MPGFEQTIREKFRPHDPMNSLTRTVMRLTLLCLALSVTAVGWMHFTTTEVITRVPGKLQSAGLDGGGGEHTRPLHVHASGVVEFVGCAAGDTVRQGDRVLQLDTTEIDHQISANELEQGRLKDEIASLARSKTLQKKHFLTQQQELRAGLASAREALAVQKEERRLALNAAELASKTAANQLGRVDSFDASRVISEIKLDQFKQDAELTALRAAMLRLPVLDGHLEVLECELKSLASAFEQNDERSARDISRLQWQLGAAQLELTELRLLRKRLVVYSPLNGVVTEVTVYPDDHVSPGALGILMAHEGIEFEAQVPIREAPNLRVGQLARIQLDAVDAHSHWLLTGTVKSISPDSTSTAAGADALPVYVVRVAIPDPQQQLGDRLQQLRLGATGSVEIVTGAKSVLRTLLDKGINLTHWD